MLILSGTRTCQRDFTPPESGYYETLYDLTIVSEPCYADRVWAKIYAS